MEDKLDTLISLEKQSLEKLTTIKKWVVFWGILTVISLVGGATYGILVALEAL